MVELDFIVWSRAQKAFIFLCAAKSKSTFSSFSTRTVNEENEPIDGTMPV